MKKSFYQSYLIFPNLPRHRWIDVYLSEKQLAHVTNSEPGSGLILFDNVVIPFVDKYPTNTKTYAIMNTKPEEAVKKDEAS